MKKIISFTVFVSAFNFLQSQTITFMQASGSPITNAASNRGLISRDINGDGIKDLLVANPNTNSIRVMLGSGNGQFTNAPGSPMTMTVNNGPIYIAIANFNGDAFLDLAIANYYSGNISILLGNGTGVFTVAPGSPYTTGTLPYSIDVADFNLDGKIDLVTCNALGNDIFLFHGNGAGTFTVAPGFPIAAGGTPYHVSAAFFNSDIYPDFAVANGSGNTVNVYLGSSNGLYTNSPGSPYTTGNEPRTIAVKDINADGFSDMVITNLSSSNINVMLGSSTGAFSNAPGSPMSVGAAPYQSTIADFDLNGTLDLAVTNNGNNTISILLGTGNGSYVPATNSPITPLGIEPQPICNADFDGDGKTDLAIGDWTGDKINVLLNKTVVPCNLLAAFTQTAGSAGSFSFTSTSTGTTPGSTFGWGFGDGSSGSGISTSHTYTANGIYTATLTVTNYSPGCVGSFTKSVTVSKIIGLSELNPDSYFSIFPNPSRGMIEVKNTDGGSGTEFVVYDVLGKEEFRTGLSPAVSNYVDLNVLKDGVYFYQLVRKGQKIKSGQLVLEK